MVLEFDTTRRPHRPRDWHAIVRAVYGAHEGDESDWIEWKSTLDFGEREGQFKAARAVLGFANRMPAVAALHLEGFALLVIGVEPGEYYGVAHLDGAELQNRLERYLGTGPEWEPRNLTVDGHDVVVIAVRPPRDGDPIFTLQTTFDRDGAGRVFVRRGSKTLQANAREMDALQRRLLAGNTPSEIGQLVTVADVGARPSINDCVFEDRDLQPILRAKHDELIGTARDGLERRLVGLRAGTPTDGYRADVREYMLRFDAWLRGAIARSLAYMANDPIRLQLHNVSNENLVDVEVRLVIDAALHMYVDLTKDDAVDFTPPVPPRDRLPDFGFHQPARQILDFARSATVARRDGETLVVFKAVSIRPHDVVQLPVLHAVGVGGHSPSPVQMQWTATATSHNGAVSGELWLDMTGEVHTVNYRRLASLLDLEVAE